MPLTECGLNRKSQIAVEFCYRFNGEHPDGWVLWVHASSITRFEEAYKEIARKARLPGWHDPKVNTLKLVCEWLSGESVERWLLVLDNADNEDVFFSTKSDLSSEELERENPLANYIPRSPHGSVMITTRDERVGLRLAEGEAPVAVLQLDVQDAERLLRSRTCGDDISDEADSKKLLHALGYLPLAITQAAAFISENRMTVSGYLEALRASDEDIKDLLSEELEDSRRDSRTRNSVIRTWKLSFDQIRKQKPRAAEILSLMSVLDRQGIPKSILRREDDRSIEFTTAIGALVAFSLISAERTGENLEMHRLVQLSTQRWLEVEGEIVQWQQKALKLLSKVFPEGIFENWAICNRLVPHVQIAIKYSVDSRTCQLRRAAILNNVSVYDREQGRYGMAFDKCSEALATREKILGAEHPDTLISVSNLASVLRHQGKYKEAEEMCRRALKGKENQKDSRTLDSLSLLALVLRYRGKYEEAEEMNRRALEGREKLLGPEHPHTLTSVSDLGSVLRYQERYEAAENIHRRALEGREKVLGAENPDTLTSVSNLASVLRYQREYVAAEEMNRRALEGREKVLGTEHPDTLTSVGIMASVLQGQGKYEAAEKMNRRVLEGREKVLGVEHPRTLISVNNLALLFQYQAKYEEAKKMHQRALEGRKRVLGVEHPDTLTSINNLASVLQKLAQM
jgi:tetratricopeptide (TPR) repeat protein